MVKAVKGKTGFLAVVAAATVVGSISTVAAVGALVNAPKVSALTDGDPVGLAAFVNSTTLDTTYSRHVSDGKIVSGVPDPDNSALYDAACFEVDFEPRFVMAVTAPVFPNPVTNGYAAGQSAAYADYIEDICGVGYNAAYLLTDTTNLYDDNYSFL